MKKVIFVDRDGTIIIEPDISQNEQVDSFEKFHFVPGAISALKNLAGLGYELVLASNQDGLGTESYPEDTFWPTHNFMLETLAGEGVVFDDQLIDRHFPSDNSPERKPGTGMFGKYLSGGYDLAASFVIGDRVTDMELARNLGAKGLLLVSAGLPASSGPCPPSDTLEGGPSRSGGGMRVGDPKSGEECNSPVTEGMSWSEIVEYIRSGDRCAEVDRKTRETDIHVRVDLDGKGSSSVDTGLKFLDHMLDQLVHHGGISLELTCRGDLQVDEHHTMEDVAICLGEAIARALGDKRGIERYGFALPMDESRAMVLLDFGGRSELVWDVAFTREYVGDVPTEMFRHFFKSLSDAMKCNLHVQAGGENCHHIAEAVFKAFARALRQAVRRNVFSDELPSSKGCL